MSVRQYVVCSLSETYRYPALCLIYYVSYSILRVIYPTLHTVQCTLTPTMANIIMFGIQFRKVFRILSDIRCSSKRRFPQNIRSSHFYFFLYSSVSNLRLACRTNSMSKISSDTTLGAVLTGLARLYMRCICR